MVNSDGELWTECDCDTSPLWYKVMISVNHLFLTINRSEKIYNLEKGHFSHSF